MALRIAVIGGGAAGFFAAITAASHKNTYVTLFEKSGKVLSKVRISGGGRCNVTHSCFDPQRLIEYYPRGKKELRNVFAKFNAKHTVEWFESRGVKLKTEDDGRMFPVTDDSATIVDCLLREANKLKVDLKLHCVVEVLSKNNSGLFEIISQGKQYIFDRVIVTTGGNPNITGYNWIAKTGHTIIQPVPSLFTFNIPDSPLKGLEGISVSEASVSINGIRHKETGPVLITHWGISGPAVIKLSAWAARELHEKKYDAIVSINWLPEHTFESMQSFIANIKKEHAIKKVSTVSPFNIPQRLWERLCELSNINKADNYADLSKDKVNKLCRNIVNMQLHQKGKTTYKEEFVTSGGVTLKEIDMQTMQSKLVPGLFFAGEVLDIDGVTGGFNFQAAWTTGWVAGMNAVL